MPTLPVDHGCAASHSMMVYESAFSAGEKAPSLTPNDAPVPRASATATTYPLLERCCSTGSSSTAVWSFPVSSSVARW